jgi:hypothetical protein
MTNREQGAGQPVSAAALYANGKTPLVFDSAVFTRTFEDGPPVTAEVQVARVDYERKTAVIVFGERDQEAIQALSLGRHFHTTVFLGELRAARRAGEVNPDFEISHEMAVTLHTLSGGERGFDFHSQVEGAISNALEEHRRMLRAEDAIAGHIYYSQRETLSYDCTINPENLPASHFAKLAGKARETALTRLSRLTDAAALSVIEGKRLRERDGSSFPIASVEDVQKRRAHLRNMQGYRAAGERILRRLRAQASRRENTFDPKQHGLLAFESGGELRRLRVLESAAGFYIGTLTAQGEPYTRESTGYYPSRKDAKQHLKAHSFLQKPAL